MISAVMRSRSTARARYHAQRRAQRGPFYRPELETPWQRFLHDRIVQVVAVIVLVAALSLLVWALVS
jgi:hypothetical protein